MVLNATFCKQKYNSLLVIKIVKGDNKVQKWDSKLIMFQILKFIYYFYIFLKHVRTLK